MPTLDLSWQSISKCVTEREKAQRIEFFPNERNLQLIRAAKAFCQGCPVRIECMYYAIDTNSPGIYGGTTKDERSFLQVLIPRPDFPKSSAFDHHTHTEYQMPEQTSQLPVPDIFSSDTSNENEPLFQFLPAAV